jgi:hypothetical protein
MAWDPNRPVPWRRLVREWAIYVVVMAVIFLIFFNDRLTPGPFVGLLLSGPVYVAIGAVLAKFGYQRATLREARAVGRARNQQRAAAAAAAEPAPRSRPAPTKRTGGGANRPTASSKRR